MGHRQNNHIKSEKYNDILPHKHYFTYLIHIHLYTHTNLCTQSEILHHAPVHIDLCSVGLLGVASLALVVLCRFRNCDDILYVRLFTFVYIRPWCAWEG